MDAGAFPGAEGTPFSWEQLSSSPKKPFCTMSLKRSMLPPPKRSPKALPRSSATCVATSTPTSSISVAAPTGKPKAVEMASTFFGSTPSCRIGGEAMGSRDEVLESQCGAENPAPLTDCKQEPRAGWGQPQDPGLVTHISSCPHPG